MSIVLPSVFGYTKAQDWQFCTAAKVVGAGTALAIDMTIAIPSADLADTTNASDLRAALTDGTLLTVNVFSCAVAAGTATITCTVSGFATSPTTMSYQWKKNDSNVGTNSSSYSEANMQAGANYTCTITNDGGSMDSTIADINIKSCSRFYEKFQIIGGNSLWNQ